MGYGSYILPDGREAGYMVDATCDKDGCETEIDRGLGYLCGRFPNGHRDDNEPGCGNYFCLEHQDAHDCPNPDGVPPDEYGDWEWQHAEGWVLKGVGNGPEGD